MDAADVDDAGGSGDEHLAISSGVGEGPHDPVKDRLLIPLLLPILCVIAVGMLAVNISRVFLAGTSTVALIGAIIVTLSILGGASLLVGQPAPAHLVARDDHRAHRGDRGVGGAAHARSQPRARGG